MSGAAGGRGGRGVLLGRAALLLLLLRVGSVDAGPDDDDGSQAGWAGCCSAGCAARTSRDDCNAPNPLWCASRKDGSNQQACGVCSWVYSSTDDDDSSAPAAWGCIFVTPTSSSGGRPTVGHKEVEVTDVEAAVIMPEHAPPNGLPDTRFSARQGSATAFSSRPTAPPPASTEGIASEGFKTCMVDNEFDTPTFDTCGVPGTAFPVQHPIAWTAMIKDRGGAGASAPTLPAPPPGTPPGCTPRSGTPPPDWSAVNQTVGTLPPLAGRASGPYLPAFSRPMELVTGVNVDQAGASALTVPLPTPTLPRSYESGYAPGGDRKESMC